MTKSERQHINKMRSGYGKRNGRLAWWVFDYGPRGPFTEKRAKAAKPKYKRIALRDALSEAGL